MTASKADGQRGDSRRRGWQFSLRALFGVTTLVAVICALYLACPPRIGAVADLCLIVSTPVVLTAVAICRRGYARTFSIGALFGAAAFLFPQLTFYGLEMVGEGVEEIIDVDEGGNVTAPLFIGLYYGAVFGTGLLAVLVRRLLDSAGPQDEREPRLGEMEP
jgi:hypothetical protein